MSNSKPLEGHAARMYAADVASQAMGIDVRIPTPGDAVATMTITDDMMNGFAICHGGYVFALADTAFAFACNSGEQVTVAAGAQIDYLKPVKAGERLTATATVRSQGGRAGVYDVSVVNDSGTEVAVFRGRAQRLSRRHDEAQE